VDLGDPANLNTLNSTGKEGGREGGRESETTRKKKLERLIQINPPFPSSLFQQAVHGPLRQDGHARWEGGRKR